MRPHDVFFGKLIRLLAELDLEMHTPRKGETWVCKRRPRRPPRVYVAPQDRL
jgi:hypothetical protein